MIKTTLPAMFCLLLVIEPVRAETKYYDLGSGTQTTVRTVIPKLAASDIVVLGEVHDNSAGHREQLKIIQQLHKVCPELVISMEMFERDVQGAVDDYLRGRISEDEFLKAARPWSNYKEHYRPILEFAKKNNLDVIAANIPRRIANKISQGDETPSVDRVFLPRKTSAPHDSYWERFQQAMEGHAGTGQGKGKSMFNYYRSQCLKDDTMAESICDFRAKHRHGKVLVVHLCGKFHSDEGLGTVMRILEREPLTQIRVVTMDVIPTDAQWSLDEVRGRAHFSIVVPEDPPQPFVPEKQPEDRKPEKKKPATRKK